MALDGFIPVFLIIALGWGVRAVGVVAKDEWGAVSRLAYWVMIPAILFSMIARIDFGEEGSAQFLAATACAFLAMGAITLVSRFALRSIDGPTYSSFVQGSVRWNGFLCYSRQAPSLFGPDGEAMTALIFAASVPIVNVISVGALYFWARPANAVGFGIARRLATNPLILSSLAGVLWALTDLPTAGFTFDALDIIGRAGFGYDAALCRCRT